MRRALLLIAAGFTLTLAALLVYFTMQVRRHAARDDPHPADVIVILGAAEYRGRPSPVLKARLDHGLELWRRKLAPRILTTGGAGGDPIFTEGEVGRTYLIRNNVPPEAIIVEPEGSTTAQSVAAAGEIMRRMGLRSCLVVTDGYHMFRARKMLEARGLKVYGSPRPSSAPDDWRYWWLCSRQAAGYLLWRAGIVL
jgi:uncharacterized SAM-binding protein YcdF (DUF218 family)